MALNRSLAPWTSNPRGALAISSGLGMRPLMERPGRLENFRTFYDFLGDSNLGSNP